MKSKTVLKNQWKYRNDLSNSIEQERYLSDRKKYFVNFFQ
ncbi:hypothetical protein LAC1533_0553 [Ligilactobacillus acidipiscis]|uniref:Uncharacterized protein n=1 Tax=Ligilactobacillus acidipiscis TaxID=89059 RepID=A0A1K1KM42_9LACO|nr:hypothetical protein LAC1533_0553 [Ligilactobacillus acidipiscis]